jgi:putative ABC transport system ATP-binding protein
MTIIDVKNLVKYYGSKKIFDHFNFSVNEGEFISICGKSGSGKSTLLNIVGLIEDFDEGDVEIFNKKAPKPNSSPATKFIRKNINYLFQNFALVPNLTVEKNLLMSLAYDKMSEKKKIEKIKFALEEVSMGDSLRQPVYTLSGGEQQRIAIARILLKQGDLLLIDEPTASLDPENSEKVFHLIRLLQTRHQKTILMVTHNEDLAKQTDRIIEI